MAQDHYRHGRPKDALTNALKALESTMKVIAVKRQWSGYDPNMQAKGLIDLCYANDLIPKYWQTHFAGLRSTLEAGVPTARNKDGGHGQGDEIKIVPDHIAAYVLHQTAAAIVFLAAADKEL